MSNDHKSPEDLEAEREFLLRSLDDLDTELLAGNIDPDKYRVLHDDYTARASAVIQSIADGVERDAPDAPTVPRAMRAVTIGGIVVFAILAAILLAHAVGQRSSGGEITGDSQTKGSTTTESPDAALAAAKAVAAAQPKSYSAQIQYARLLMADGALPAAIQQYVAASKVDATQAEPLAWSGYLTIQVVPQVTDPATQKTLIAAAAKSLKQAIVVDPTYSESYAFEGVLLAQFENKPCAGAVDFAHFLASAPQSDPFYSDVGTALTTAMKAGKCPETKSTPTTKP